MSARGVHFEAPPPQRSEVSTAPLPSHLSSEGSQALFDKALETPAYSIKGASCVALHGWAKEAPHLVEARSSQLHRPASHPLMPPDLARESVDELHYRKNLHGYLMQHRPAAFKKVFLKESPSEFYLQRHLVRDYLLEMHMWQTPKDIGWKDKKYKPTISLKKKEAAPELRSKIEDFLQPKNPTRQRVIGYSPGHIRSMLDLDTFGPSHSQSVESKRAAGLLPRSMNADRNIATPPSPGMRRHSHLDDALAASQSILSHDTGTGIPSSLEASTSVVDSPTSPSGGRPRTGASLATVSTGQQSKGGSTISAGANNNNNISAEAIQELEHNLLRSTPTVMRFSYDKSLRNTHRAKTQRSELSLAQQRQQMAIRRDVEDYKTSIARFERSLPSLMDRS